MFLGMILRPMQAKWCRTMQKFRIKEPFCASYGEFIGYCGMLKGSLGIAKRPLGIPSGVVGATA